MIDLINSDIIIEMPKFRDRVRELIRGYMDLVGRRYRELSQLSESLGLLNLKGQMAERAPQSERPVECGRANMTESSATSESDGAKTAVTIFFAYARKDQQLLAELREHLAPLRRQGKIADWHDRNIEAGQEWEKEIDRHLQSADIILLLVSSSFMNSDYCYSVEMQRAIARHASDEAIVIPVILRAVYWQDSELRRLQALPSNATPVTSWPDRDQAWLSVVEGISRRIEQFPLTKRNRAPIKNIRTLETEVADTGEASPTGGTDETRTAGPEPSARIVHRYPSQGSVVPWSRKSQHSTIVIRLFYEGREPARDLELSVTFPDGSERKSGRIASLHPETERMLQVPVRESDFDDPGKRTLDYSVVWRDTAGQHSFQLRIRVEGEWASNWRSYIEDTNA